MNFYSPAEILDYTTKKGVEKAEAGLAKLVILAFLGGMYIALGFLACLRIQSSMSGDLAGLGAFLGAAVFPVGLVAVLMAGGELITGNMLVMAVACLNRAISPKALLRNWVVVTLGNFAGAAATAYFLCHLTGMAQGAMLEKILGSAAGKVDATFVQMFFSGIGCNIFVGLGVWLAFGAKDFAGKILAIWFPVAAFVSIGFQHVVANMFLIPAAMFSGESELSLLDLFGNLGPVWLGNAVGGAILLGLLYCVAYGKKVQAAKPEQAGKPVPVPMEEAGEHV